MPSRSLSQASRVANRLSRSYPIWPRPWLIEPAFLKGAKKSYSLETDLKKPRSVRLFRAWFPQNPRPSTTSEDAASAIGGIQTGFPVRGRACICTKSGQQPVDGLHSIGNTCGCRCQFLIDSGFGRSRNGCTRSPDNSSTHFNSNPAIGFADTWCDAANEGIDWITGRGDSARRCPPRERTAGFLTVGRGRKDKPVHQLQGATGRVVATLLWMTTLRQGVGLAGVLIFAFVPNGSLRSGASPRAPFWASVSCAT
jgi:hypothetical protein